MPGIIVRLLTGRVLNVKENEKAPYMDVSQLESLKEILSELFSVFVKLIVVTGREGTRFINLQIMFKS